MRNCEATPVDIEHALSLACAAIMAPPVPDDLMGVYSVAFATGGHRSEYVRDVRYVDVDTYAEDEQTAIAASSAIVPLLEALQSTTIGGTSWQRVACTTLPYINPDPRRPDLARATASYEISVRPSIN